MTGHGLTAAQAASMRSMAETLPITVGGELHPAPKVKQLLLVSVSLRLPICKQLGWNYCQLTRTDSIFS